MKSGSSAGPDGIHPRVIKEVQKEVAPALCRIFDLSMRISLVPKAWKDAIVVPIFKKGQRKDPGNYRPVSLTSICGKLMERLIRRSVLHHFNVNRLLTCHQHGFRCGRSCVTQLLTVMETWSEWAEERVPFDCVYLDYRKAFDSVPHIRLLRKLEALGITGNLLKWLKIVSF